jgi:hypothetical protein
MKRERIVTGISDHYAWAAAVSVVARNGQPEVVDRRKMELLAPGLPASPYHHDTVTMDAAIAEALVKQVQSSALRCARRELEGLREELKGDLVAIVLREPPLPALPASVAEAQASYHVLTRADGMIYHHALCAAAAELGIRVELIARGEERPLAASALGVDLAVLDRWLSDLRKTLGPPWQKDQQEATARAVALLSDMAKLGGQLSLERAD